MTGNDHPVVELRQVSKRFGVVQALRDVDLALHPGQVLALAGENGAGKSTVVRMLGGVHSPDSGELVVHGKPVHLRRPADARALGIAIVHQHPALFGDLSIAENVFSAEPPLGRVHAVAWRRMQARAENLLAELGVALDVRRPVGGLSLADQQTVEIAKALAQDASVLVLDEPTAAISADETERLFSVVSRLRDRGTAILFISHRLEEVFAIADGVTVLRMGEHVITAPASELTPEETIKHMVGRTLGQLFPKVGATAGEEVLSVTGLTREGVFEDVGFSVRAGEILGFAGLVGSGRTEVARVVFGIDRADAGEVRVHGKAVPLRSPAAAMRHGIAYVPEDRHRQGLVLELPVAANASMAILDRLRGRLGLLDRKRERRLAQEYGERTGLRASGVDQIVSTLSGGNQQKVVLGKWLASDPKLLILDEPTRGIDIGAKAQIHEMVSRLAADGLAIVLISSELPEVLAMSDRVLVFREGVITAELDRTEATEEAVLTAAAGRVADLEDAMEGAT